jgi:hypothetical protein
MNRKTFVIAGMALALSAGAALAQGQNSQTPPPPRHGPPGGPDGGRGGEIGRGRMGHRPYATREELQKRQADAFARMDANKDGRVTFEEFRADLERRKLERQREMFKRFSGGQDSVTLDQLKAREAQRFQGRGRGGPGERRAPPPVQGAGAPPVR